MKKQYTILLILLFPLSIFAQPLINWNNLIGGDYIDIPFCITPLDDGGYIVGGKSGSSAQGEKTAGNFGGDDCWVVKLNANGTKIWDKSYGGNNDDQLNKIIPSSNGGFVMVGRSKSDSSGNKTEDSRGDYDFWILKTESNGNLIWEKTLGGNAIDHSFDIIEDKEGGLLVIGNSESGISGDRTVESKDLDDFWVVKLNSQGELDWEMALDGYHGMYETHNNSYVIFCDGDTIKEIAYDKSTITKTFVGSGKIAGNMIVCKDGGYASGESNGDFEIKKYDSSWNLTWQNTFGSDENNILNSFIQTPSGDFVLGGSSYADISKDKSEDGYGGGDYWIVLVDSNGEKKWDKTLGGDELDFFEDVCVGKDGRLVCAGWSFSNASGSVSDVNNGICNYWVVKLFEPSRTITGQAFAVSDDNCNDNLIPIKNTTFLSSNGYFTKTDENGFYELQTDSGKFEFSMKSVGIKNSLYTLACPETPHEINFEGKVKDTSGINFVFNASPCPILIVDVQSNRRRRCFRNMTVINYKNEGIATSSGTVVYLSIPEYVHLISADKPFSINDKGVYVFDIGDLEGATSGTIKIVDSVACVINNGITQCTKAWISPENQCLEELQNENLDEWDNSHIGIEGRCIGDSVEFLIINDVSTLTSNMNGPSEYRVFSDNELAYTSTFQLESSDTLRIRILADGTTYRLEANQTWGHPLRSNPKAFVEACATDNVNQISTGQINSTPLDDLDHEVSYSCMPITGSYDPNDKSVSPAGITENHYVPTGVDLNYLVRFQNTGTDTAFTVVLVDTLSENVDVSTLNVTSSSHPYEWTISEATPRVLTFTFNEINLPDSTTNEPASNGFVKFKISPLKDLEPKTEIENFVDIYFDFNLPIRTNMTHVSIFDTIPESEVIIEPSSCLSPCETKVISSSVKQDVSFAYVRAYPNPVLHKLNIQLLKKGLQVKDIKLYDISGVEISKRAAITALNITIDTSELMKGTYVYKLYTKEGTVLVGRFTK